jgi:thiol-disulfide isomerase/thioredoxin
MSNYNLKTLGGEPTSYFSNIKQRITNMNFNSILIILFVIIIITISIFYYMYYIVPKQSSAIYKANHEQVPNGSATNSNTAELLFFYADWCPHCKTAKPIWNSLQEEYKNKTINGYTILFTEINCSEETAEVDKMMNQYNVEGYPTIKLLKDGQVIEYDAKPTKETLNQFLNTVL